MHKREPRRRAYARWPSGSIFILALILSHVQPYPSVFVMSLFHFLCSRGLSVFTIYKLFTYRFKRHLPVSRVSERARALFSVLWAGR